MVFSARGDFSVFSDFAGHQCYQPGSISTFALFQPQKWATLSNQFWTCHEHGCHWVPGYEMIWAWVKNGQNMSKFHIPRIPTGSFVPPCQVSSAPSLFVPWGLMFASSWRMRCAAPSTAWESDKGCLGNWNGWSPAKKQSLEDGFPVQSLIVRVAMLLFALLVFALVFNIDGDSKKHSSMTHIILLGVNSIQPQRTMCKPPKILDSAQLSSGCMFSGVFSMLYYPHLLFFIFSCDYIHTLVILWVIPETVLLSPI